MRQFILVYEQLHLFCLLDCKTIKEEREKKEEEHFLFERLSADVRRKLDQRN